MFFKMVTLYHLFVNSGKALKKGKMPKRSPGNLIHVYENIESNKYLIFYRPKEHYQIVPTLERIDISQWQKLFTHVNLFGAVKNFLSK